MATHASGAIHVDQAAGRENFPGVSVEHFPSLKIPREGIPAPGFVQRLTLPVGGVRHDGRHE
jgi:hypothetical protein